MTGRATNVTDGGQSPVLFKSRSRRMIPQDRSSSTLSKGSEWLTCQRSGHCGPTLDAYRGNDFERRQRRSFSDLTNDACAAVGNRQEGCIDFNRVAAHDEEPPFLPGTSSWRFDHRRIKDVVLLAVWCSFGHGQGARSPEPE